MNDETKEEDSSFMICYFKYNNKAKYDKIDNI